MSMDSKSPYSAEKSPAPDTPLIYWGATVPERKYSLYFCFLIFQKHNVSISEATGQ